MKLFPEREIQQAYDHAAEGGQALHVYRSLWGNGKAPACFQNAKEWGHLLDQDRARLERTAHALGVRRVVIHLPRTNKQHVDLCGAPLRRAIRQATAAPEQVQEALPC